MSQFNEMLLSVAAQQAQRDLVAKGKDAAYPSHLQPSSIHSSQSRQRSRTDSRDDEHILLKSGSVKAKGVFDMVSNEN